MAYDVDEWRSMKTAFYGAINSLQVSLISRVFNFQYLAVFDHKASVWLMTAVLAWFPGLLFSCTKVN